jgi:hypothetical protein
VLDHREHGNHIERIASRQRIRENAWYELNRGAFDLPFEPWVDSDPGAQVFHLAEQCAIGSSDV